MIKSNAQIKDELGALIGKNTKLQDKSLTIFKSLGLAIEDLVAAKLTYEKVKKSSPWPVKYIGNDEMENNMKSIKFESIKAKMRVTNKLTNFICKAMHINSETMVCEMKTNSLQIALLYETKTGQLIKILDTNSLENLTENERCGFYVCVNQK